MKVSRQRKSLWIDDAVLVLICLPLLLVRLKMLISPLPMNDFVTYWAAGRLFLTGGDPYSMAATYAISRNLGWAYTNQFVMLNPPWVLLYVGPLAWMPFDVAHLVNFGVDLLLNLASTVALWYYFGGPWKRSWIAIVLLATYMPAALAEHYGQITPIILAGLTGFLFSIRHGKYVLAGMCILVLGLKAHLLYLLLIAVLLWSVRERRWSMLVTAILLGIGTTAAFVSFNRKVGGYFHGTMQAALDTSCGVGGLLRQAFGVQHVWLQFVSSVLGVAWFARYWFLHRHRWVWKERLPFLLLVTLATSPYFWVHDFILAMPTIVAAARSVPGRKEWQLAALGYVAVQAIISLGGHELSATACLLWIPLYWYVTSRQEAAACAEHLNQLVQGA